MEPLFRTIIGAIFAILATFMAAPSAPRSKSSKHTNANDIIKVQSSGNGESSADQRPRLLRRVGGAGVSEDDIATMAEAALLLEKART